MDWERFEAEFADLDAELDTGSSLADRILAVVRARRARRRVLAVVAGAMIAAGLVVPVLLIVLPGRTSTANGAASASPDTATRAHIYAAVLRGVPALSGASTLSRAPSGNRAPAHGNAAAMGGPPAPQRLVQRIWVSTRVCQAVPTSPGASSCAGGQIPPAVQRQVAAVFGTRVRFSATPPPPRRAAPVVQFGLLVVHGKHAGLGIEIRCGPRCGGARTVQLREKAGHWTLR